MLVKRLRWMAMGAAVSYVSKVKTQRDIDRATEGLNERLPDPVHRAVQALPGDLSRIGGSAIVAKNNAATAAKATVAVTRAARSAAGSASRAAGSASRAAGSASRAAGSASRAAGSASQVPRDLRTRLQAARFELGVEIEHERRRLKSDAVRETEGEGAALEALLDLRATDIEPLPVVKPPIDRGRKRHQPVRPAPPVARVQRSYLPPVNPWDRPRRNRPSDR